MICLSSSIKAIELEKGAYSSYQKISYAEEEVIIGKDYTNISLTAYIIINNSFFLENSNWLSLDFKPESPIRNNYDHLNITIKLNSPKINKRLDYNCSIESYSYVCNITLNKSWDTPILIFSAKYRLKNKLISEDKYYYKYSFRHKTRISDFKNYDITYYIPLKYRIESTNFEYNKRQDRGFNIIEITADEEKEEYFILIDLDEKRESERQEKREGAAWDIALVLISLFLALGISHYKDWINTPIRKKVKKLLNKELSSILTDISTICGFHEVISSSDELTSEEIMKKDTEIILKKVEKYSKKRKLKVKKTYKNHILEGNFGNLFNRRKNNLNSIQLKYTNYIKPEILISIINIQEAFRYIDQDITIRNKQIKNKWLKLRNDEDIIKSIENNLHKIVKELQFMIDKGILKYK